MKTLDRETSVSVDGEYVVYRMIPEVALALMDLLSARAAATNDIGWRDDAKRLREAVDELAGQS